VNVLVDTSAWSLALRRRPHELNDLEQRFRREVEELVAEGRAQIIGLVRQEVLSGIAEAAFFDRLRRILRNFDDASIDSNVHERAAELWNHCRAKGVQGSHTDFLICAVAERQDLAILSTDPDFERYALHIPIRLHIPREAF